MHRHFSARIQRVFQIHKRIGFRYDELSIQGDKRHETNTIDCCYCYDFHSI